MANNNDIHVVDSFRRGQVLFLVDGILVDGLQDWAQAIAARPEHDLFLENFRELPFPSVTDLLEQSGESPDTPEPPPPDIEGPVLTLGEFRKRRYSSPTVNEQGSFVLVSADVPKLAEIPDPMLVSGREMADRLSENASRLLRFIRTLDSERREILEGRLQVVSPNWLAAGGRDSQPGTTGGPGGKPTPADGPANIGFEDYKFNLPDAILESVENDKMGEGVVVAILDTTPKRDGVVPGGGGTWVTQHAGDPLLAQIYEKWVTNRTINPPQEHPDPHPLIEGLLNPDNPHLTVYLHEDIDKDNANIEPKGYIQADKHDYEMTDHGLFVAGIIHSLAPKAQLHLFQVLNRYGVGDLRTFAEALHKVVHDFAGQRIVVNASLIVGPPQEDQHTRNHEDDDDHDDDQDNIGRSILNSKDEQEEDPWFGRQDMIAKRICEFVYALRSRVIAAAGNNHNNNRQVNRPRACYPAALEGVLGVGALPKLKTPPASGRFKTTSYSNLSDRPQGTGITTLGGEKGKGKGILGIYAADFPPPNNPPHNRNGWAWWSGTSFATPIISGILAAMLSNLPDGSRTEDAVGVLFQVFQAQPYETDDKEEVLFVTQGP